MATPNKSLDVRAKQRLSYRVVFLTQSCVNSVSPHVNSIVRNGGWYILRSSQGFIGIQFGEAADRPVPADYDGDGRADVAVFRPSNGTWYLNRSTAGFVGMQFGITTDVPAPADYDGDGKADLAVFRDGAWYLQRSTAGFTGVAFGAANDRPVPNAFVP